MKHSDSFLPMVPEDLALRGWGAIDVLLISGDAYVDHPSFGAALLGRRLHAEGFRVGIIAQPRWNCLDDITRLGRPRLFCGVTAGALDSMLAHYTAFRKKRHDDAYTPGGRSGARPNRACIVYANLVRRAFPGVPIVLGGIEASLRRVSHYDFWDDAVRRPLLLDAKAELLVYGMGERAVLEVARRLRRHADTAPPETAAPETADACTRASAPRVPPTLLHGIAGTVYAAAEFTPPADAKVHRLPSHEEIQADPRRLMDATLTLERQVGEGDSWAVQLCEKRAVVVAPPAPPLSTPELDALYALPFTRLAHPSYREPIPALEMIQFSLTAHRGCAGGCSFCSLALHQGRRIASRGKTSLLDEARRCTQHPDWRGSITDVGGPSGNMWGGRCAADPARCRRRSCLTPSLCPHFQVDQKALTRMLRAMQKIPGVRHVRMASGIRHDLALEDPEFTRTLVREFVGGQLKLAPEHCCDRVLEQMRKPAFKTFERFLTILDKESDRAGKEQYVVPYLMSAFPGCTEEDMRTLAAWLRARHWKPRQVQCFIPLPGTVAAAMFYAGIDTAGRPIPVARTDAARLRQHRILIPDSEDYKKTYRRKKSAKAMPQHE
jgi:uncharacterized radical SAM protein YgiQ